MFDKFYCENRKKIEWSGWPTKLNER